MNKLTYGIAIGAVVLSVGGYFGINTFAQSDATQEVQTAAETAPVIIESDKIIVDAVVVPVREADLSVATSGIVKTVLVEEGDYVEAGQPLLQLNDERLQASLAQAEANLANAEANLADLQAPPKAEEVAKYQSNITSAQASLQNVLDGASNASIAAKEASLANAEAELRIAQSDYDEEKWRTDIAMRPEALELEKATNNYNAAKAELDDLLAAADQSDVASANASIVSAQSDLDLLLAGADQQAIVAAQATVAANQASVRDAQAALNEATLVAPFAGIVAAVNSEVGEQVSSGVAVIQLADTTEWRIETEDLTELDVVDVARGDMVEVRFDALDAVMLEGTVKNIKPLGENNQDDITYTVLVELNKQDERLRWNMSAEANITADEAGRAAALNPSEDPGKAAPTQAFTQDEDSNPGSAVKTIGDIMATEEVSTSVDATANTTANTTTNTTANATVNVNGSMLNVRQGPGTDFAIVDALADTSAVSVLSSNTGGTWVEIALSDSKRGWVSTEFLRLESTNANLAISGEQSGL